MDGQFLKNKKNNMNKIIKKISLLSFALLLFQACDDNETSNITIVPLDPIDIAVTVNENDVIINESEIDTSQDYTITATIEEAQQVDLALMLTQTGGTATLGDDFGFHDEYIIISAGETTASAVVHIYKTGDIETTDETLSVGLITADKNAKIAAFNFNATITDDYITDVLDFSTTWAGSTTANLIGGVTAELDFCAIDIDVLLFNSTGDFLGYLGATGDCIETGSMSGLPDGEYYVVLDLYSNDLVPYGSTETLPVTISYNQESFISGSIVNTELNLSSPIGQTAAVVVTKNGYNYTVAAF
jgi:hypothetical protein